MIKYICDWCGKEMEDMGHDIRVYLFPSRKETDTCPDCYEDIAKKLDIWFANWKHSRKGTNV
jgi:hypothetical protein